MHSATPLLIFLSLAAAQLVPLTLLPPTSLGKCLDGSSSGFYFRPGPNRSKFIIHFDGGGECFSEPSCSSHLHTSLGSSNFFAKNVSFAGSWLLDPSPSANPGFSSWSHVRVPYCTQDLHMGTRTAVSSGTWGLYFSGQHVFEAVLAALEADGGLLDATDIILSGDSAGGIAVWPKLAFTAARYPAARVAGAPVAGFYFYSYPYVGPNSQPGGLAPFSPSGMASLFSLYAPALDAACVSFYSSDPGACMLSNNSLPFIKQDVFVTEAQTDSVQLTAHDNVSSTFGPPPPPHSRWPSPHNISPPFTPRSPTQPQINPADKNQAPERAYIQQWKENMTVGLSPVLSPSSPTTRGGFNPACFIHTSFTAEKPLINGVSFLQAAAAWYAGLGGGAGYKLADTCGLFCNPTCP